MTEVTPSPENTSFSDLFDYNCFTNTALMADYFGRSEESISVRLFYMGLTRKAPVSPPARKKLNNE